MKPIRFVLAGLVTLFACTKQASPIASISAENIKPCEVTIVCTVSQPELFTLPLMKVWMSLDPAKEMTSFLTTNVMKDGKMSLTYPCAYPDTRYYFKVRLFRGDSVFYDSEEMTFVTADLSSDMVDMGLSVKWAGANLGARQPQELGTRVTSLPASLPQRLPTRAEFNELFEKCDVFTNTYHNVRGSLFISRENQNVIFFPVEHITEEAFYWCADEGQALHFMSNGMHKYEERDDSEGGFIRFVSSK